MSMILLTNWNFVKEIWIHETISNKKYEHDFSIKLKFC